MAYKIFVDGQFGTTGLKIHSLLKQRKDLEILKISESDKKSLKIKAEFLNEADLVFLCLPDEASRESVGLIKNLSTKVIDASTAHRTNNDWVYGMPELDILQRNKIKASSRVCVPGCHASGFIMAINPLIHNGLVEKNKKLIFHSITGYSGGGRGLIDKYEDNKNIDKFQSQRPYSLQLNHKHLPEIKHILGLETPPLFTPSVGNFIQGMLVMSYLVKDQFSRKISRKELLDIYNEHYKNEIFVNVIQDNIDYLDEGFLDAMKCNDSNRIEISIYENDDYMVVISRLDNLGKGASGAAVQNMNIMLDLQESLGLKI